MKSYTNKYRISLSGLHCPFPSPVIITHGLVRSFSRFSRSLPHHPLREVSDRNVENGRETGEKGMRK